MKMPPSSVVASPADDAPKRRRRSHRQEPLNPRSLPQAEDALSEISGGLRKLLGCYERVLREHAGKLYADERTRQDEVLGVNALSGRLGIRKETISEAADAGELRGTKGWFRGGKSERSFWKIRVGDAEAWHSALIEKARKFGDSIPGRGALPYSQSGSTSKAIRKPRSEDGRFPERQPDGQHD
jgi:hypothetical protein